MLVIYSALVIVLWLTIFPMIFIFVQSDRQREKEAKKVVFWFVILELILALMALPTGMSLAFAHHHHFQCDRISLNDYNVYLSLLLPVSAFQAFIMQIIWFSTYTFFLYYYIFYIIWGFSFVQSWKNREGPPLASVIILVIFFVFCFVFFVIFHDF